MSWFRIDDKAAFHKKVLKAGNEAFGALVRMGCWASDHLTDGHVPIEIATLIAHGEGSIQRLVFAGFLEKDGDDFVIHDFLEYNPTSIEVKAERARKAEAKIKSGKNGGIASGVARRNGGGEANAKQTRSETEANAKRNEAPYPSPLSLSLVSSSSSCSSSDARVAPDMPDLGEPENAKQGETVDGHLAESLAILDALNAARKRVKPSSTGIRPTYTSLAGIAGRLRAGRTIEECLRVVELGEMECRGSPDSSQWFDAVSPWRPTNFERRLAADGVASGGVMDSASSEKGRSLF